MITLEEFNAGGTDLDAQERRTRLTTNPLFDNNIKLVDVSPVNFDTAEGQEQFNKLNKTALDEGYEGLMIKPIAEGYNVKEVMSLKIKPFIEVTLKVVDPEEGTGKNEGLLGVLVVEGEDDGKSFSVECWFQD